MISSSNSQSSAGSNGASDPCHIDRDTRDELMAVVGADSVRGFVEQFLSEFEEVLPVVKEHFANRDCEAAAQAAHKVAGSAAVLGGAGLRALLIQFEMAARSGDFAEAEVLLKQVEEVKSKIGPFMLAGLD